MGVRCLVIIHISPAHLQILCIGEIRRFWPDAMRNVGASQHDPGVPAVAYQIDRVARPIFSRRMHLPDRFCAGVAADREKQNEDANPAHPSGGKPVAHKLSIAFHIVKCSAYNWRISPANSFSIAARFNFMVGVIRSFSMVHGSVVSCTACTCA